MTQTTYPFARVDGMGYPSANKTMARTTPNQNDPNQYYAMLGLTPDANLDEIKSMYRELVKEYHPDGSAPDSNAFLLVQSIYETLSDPAKKREYDSTPTGKMYLGDFEVASMTGAFIVSLLDQVVEREVEETVAMPSDYTCFVDRDEDVKVAQEWYTLLLEASSCCGYKGILRVGVCVLDRPYSILNKGGWTLFLFPQVLEPSWVVAYSALWFRTHLMKDPKGI